MLLVSSLPHGSCCRFQPLQVCSAPAPAATRRRVESVATAALCHLHKIPGPPGHTLASPKLSHWLPNTYRLRDYGAQRGPGRPLVRRLSVIQRSAAPQSRGCRLHRLGGRACGGRLHASERALLQEVLRGILRCGLGECGTGRPRRERPALTRMDLHCTIVGPLCFLRMSAWQARWAHSLRGL